MMLAMREDGAGTQTKRGYWRVRITIEDEFGRKKQKGFEAKTLAAAQRAAAIYLHKHGRVSVPEKLCGTVADLFALVDDRIWAQTGEKNRKAMNVYRRTWEAKIGDVAVSSLETPSLSRLANEMGAKKSKSYIHKLGLALRQALDFAVSDLGWIQTNRATDMRLPKPSATGKTYPDMTEKEYDKMLGLADDRCRLLIRLIGECGMRPIEAVRVRAEHLESVRDQWLVAIPKSKTTAGVRSVPVPDSLVALIEGRRDEDWKGISDPAEHLRTWWRENSKTRMYDLRGWCADQWRRRGIPDQVRTYLLGHTDPKFSQRVYESLLSPDVLDAFSPKPKVG